VADVNAPALNAAEPYIRRRVRSPTTSHTRRCTRLHVPQRRYACDWCRRGAPGLLSSNVAIRNGNTNRVQRLHKLRI